MFSREVLTDEQVEAVAWSKFLMLHIKNWFLLNDQFQVWSNILSSTLSVPSGVINDTSDIDAVD